MVYFRTRFRYTGGSLIKGEGGGYAINRELVGCPGSVYLTSFMRRSLLCQTPVPRSGAGVGEYCGVDGGAGDEEAAGYESGVEVVPPCPSQGPQERWILDDIAVAALVTLSSTQVSVLMT